MREQIEEARKNGYSNQEILDYLSKNDKNVSPQISEAFQEGYSADDIIKHLAPEGKASIAGSVGGPAIEFITRAATSIPNFIDNVSRMTGQGLNSLAKKFGFDLPPDQLEKALSLAKQIGPTGNIPQASQIREQLDQATSGKFKPQTPGENILQKSAGIAGDIIGFGPEAAIGTPLKAAATAATSGTMGALEESGANPILAAGGGILADILTRSGGALGKKILGIGKEGIPKALGSITGKVGRITPDQLKQEVLGAAERLGVKELPVSAQTSNPIIRGIESRLRQSSHSGKALETQLENTRGNLTEKYQGISNEISQRKDILPSAVSKEAMEELQKIEQTSEGTYRSLYNQAMKEVHPNARTDPKLGLSIHKILDNTLSKLKSDLGTSTKDALFTRIDRLKKNWSLDSDLKAGRIPINKMIEAKQDLNQIIKYEAQGGADKILEPLAQILRNGIQTYGREFNPRFLEPFNKAEKLFGQNAQTFRKNPVLKSLVKGQNPEQIFNRMNTVKGIRDLENVFAKSPEGRETFDALKKYKLEDLIGKKILNANGEVSFARAGGIFKDPKTRDLLVELVGPKNYKNLKDISTVSQGIEEGLRKYANPSNTTGAAIDLAVWLAPIKALGYLFSSKYLAAAKLGSIFFVPRIMANLISNPKFMEGVKLAATAGKGSNQAVFISEMKRLAAIIAAETNSDDQ